jgi:flagellar motility protein MotE (MotC chaperone)
LEKELAATEKQQAELKERIKRLEAEKDEFKVSWVERFPEAWCRD